MFVMFESRKEEESRRVKADSLKVMSVFKKASKLALMGFQEKQTF